jgi:hypothetical protein
MKYGNGEGTIMNDRRTSTASDELERQLQEAEQAQADADAAGQNLKRFLAATGWGRRNAPCGSLIALPREPEWLSALSG